jgi:hypothetical protein
MEKPDVINIAEALAERVEKAPAGGRFHNVEIGPVAGVIVPEFGGAAGFVIEYPGTDECFQIRVTPYYGSD